MQQQLHERTSMLRYTNIACVVILLYIDCIIVIRHPDDSHSGAETCCRRIKVCKGKGKAVPLQAWSRPDGSRKLRFPGFMTTAQDGGKVVSLTHQPPFPPGNTPGTHFC